MRFIFTLYIQGNQKDRWLKGFNNVTSMTSRWVSVVAVAIRTVSYPVLCVQFVTSACLQFVS